MDITGLKANGDGRPQINIPEGMTAEELCRKGMDIESGGSTAAGAAKE